jgi:hypothetical protein
LCHTNPFTLRVVSVSGNSNVIADFCSRSFSLADQKFLHQLQSHFPTHPSWQLAHPTSEKIFAMNSALSQKMLPWESASPAPMQLQPLGTCGARTVGDALRAVGQTLAGLGHADPRLQPSGKLEFQLRRQLVAYNCQDPPPTRVKPIPIDILQQTFTLARLTQHPMSDTIVDMLTLGFYFLLRPSKYVDTSNPEFSPFRLCTTCCACPICLSVD